MLIGEDEQVFLERRVAEERRRMQETSCMVRSVHAEFVEMYEERSQAAEAETVALEALLNRVA